VASSHGRLISEAAVKDWNKKTAVFTELGVKNGDKPAEKKSTGNGFCLHSSHPAAVHTPLNGHVGKKPLARVASPRHAVSMAWPGADSLASAPTACLLPLARRALLVDTLETIALLSDGRFC
jgi:hypothetical protein